MAARHIRFVSVLFALAVLPSRAEAAHAYLDPGTGSMLLQFVIAAVGAALSFGKAIWRRVTRPISVGKGEDESGRPD